MASGDRLRPALEAPPADPPGPVTLPTTSAVHLWQSLEDRLLFRQAQELLSGLTGVASDRAGPALPWAVAGGSGEGEWTGRPESPLTLDVGAVPPGGPTVLSVGGELDLATAGELRATVRALCRADQDAVPTRGEFLLRLEAVTSLDCSRVDALVGVHADVSARGMTLRVVPPADAGARRMLLLVTAMGWLPAAFVPGC